MSREADLVSLFEVEFNADGSLARLVCPADREISKAWGIMQSPMPLPSPDERREALVAFCAMIPRLRESFLKRTAKPK